MSPNSLVAERVADIGAEVGEGPIWLAEEGALLFVDITRGLAYRFFVSTGAIETCQLGQHVGAIVPRESGSFLVAAQQGIGVWDWGSEMTITNPIEADKPENRFNDAKCDPAGRLWAGTMSYEMSAGAANLYMVSAGFESVKQLSNLTISNGMAWSADSTKMYFIDSPTQSVDLMDFDLESGAISNRRSFCKVESSDGFPDGMTIDSEDCIWVAIFGSGTVRRYSPDGDWIATIETMAPQVTSCCFGGPNLEDLYITSAALKLVDGDVMPPGAGALFSCSTGVRGTPTAKFAG